MRPYELRGCFYERRRITYPYTNTEVHVRRLYQR